MKDCDEFNVMRVNQMIDCMTDEERRCMIKLMYLGLVQSSMDHVTKDLKIKDLESEKGNEAMNEYILMTVYQMANDAMVEICGKEIVSVKKEE